MSGRGAEPDAVVQNDSFIDKGGNGKQDRDVQNTPVPDQRPGSGKQQQCREDITLMHFYAEDIEQHIEQAAEPRKEADLLPADSGRKDNDKRKCHCDSAGPRPGSAYAGAHDKSGRKQETDDGFNQAIFLLTGSEIPPHAVTDAQQSQQNGCIKGFIGNGIPVSAQDIIQVGCVDGGERIGFQRTLVKIDQPVPVLVDTERYDACKKRQNADQAAVKDWFA